MKFGPRKPNVKKRIKARTTGKAKRQIKKSINPAYGKKGTGWVRNPKRAAYNKVYNKTSFGIGGSKKTNSRPSSSISEDASGHDTPSDSSGLDSCIGCLGCTGVIGLVVSFFSPPVFLISIPLILLAFYIAGKEAEKEEEREKLAKQEEQKQEEAAELLSMFEELERLFEKAEKTDNVDTFFNQYEEILTLFSEIENKTNSLQHHSISEEEANQTKQEFTTQTHELLKRFIKRYEEKAFEKATRLKTENGQRNNYQRSLDDLNEYSHYFDEETKQYLEERWQDI